MLLGNDQGLMLSVHAGKQLSVAFPPNSTDPGSIETLQSLLIRPLFSQVALVLFSQVTVHIAL
jgi:hypothetical protein